MLQRAFLLAAAGIALAQDSTSSTTIEASATVTGPISSSPTNATSTTNTPITHTVSVGYGGNTFVPDVTLAEVGDTIEFDFFPTNHSVIRAEYGYACIPYEDTGVDKVGFFSGFRPVDAILTDPPKWTLLVEDSNPIFYYCGATGSCINYQMVGVINPNASTSLVTQKQKAKDSTYMLLPGQAFPNEDQDPNSSAASSTTTSAASTPTKSSAPAATTSTQPNSSHSQGLSAGAIAGIVIGASVVALAAAVLLYFCGRQSLQGRHAPVQQQVPFQPGHGHMSYVDPNKHLSMHSSVVGPALPGYAPSEHTRNIPSPPLVAYAPSDALNPGNPSMSPAGSPDHTNAVPAYSHNGGSMQSTPHQSMYSVPGASQPMANIHEMAAPVPEGQTQQTGGILGFIRNSSVRASTGEKGGVERYS